MSLARLRYTSGVVFALLVSTNSFADSGHSIGLGAVNTSVDSDSINSAGIVYEFRSSDAVALEFGLYSGGSDTDEDGGIATAIEINGLASVKLKYGASSGKMQYYFFGGYTHINFEAIACSNVCFSDSGDLGGLTAGVGVNFDLAENWILGGQYGAGFNDIKEADFLEFSLRYKF
jgi:opacity protein-like surface antigen